MSDAIPTLEIRSCTECDDMFPCPVGEAANPDYRKCVPCFAGLTDEPDAGMVKVRTRKRRKR